MHVCTSLRNNISRAGQTPQTAIHRWNTTLTSAYAERRGCEHVVTKTCTKTHEYAGGGGGMLMVGAGSVCKGLHLFS